MSRNVHLTQSEQDLIAEIQKPEREQDKELVATLLVENLGNMLLNKKLLTLMRIEKNNKHLEALSKFTYKTQDIGKISLLVDKLELLNNFNAQGIKAAEFEKLTVAEFGMLQKLGSLEEDELLQMVGPVGNSPQYTDLLDKISRANKALTTLENNALQSTAYIAGDLMMTVTAKTSSAKGRQNWGGHEGSLEEIFVTRYNHAAPLYTGQLDNKPTKSDIWHEQRIDQVNVSEMITSDIFRIDPTRLVSKAMAKKLEQVDYGARDDGVRITWQDAMRERYTQLSQALHLGLPLQRIIEIDLLIDKARSDYSAKRAALLKKERAIEKADDALTKSNKRISEIETLLGSQNKGDMAALRQELESLKLDVAAIHREFPSIQSAQEQLKREQKELKSAAQRCDDLVDKLQQEQEVLKARPLLQNDQDRLSNPLMWVGIRASIKGHSTWFAQNNFRDLSRKMFDATPEQKAMICSEWSARCIMSTMDQLNRLTSIDLQSAGIVPHDKEKQVLERPISDRERFDKLTPVRLVSLLSKAGCVETVHNSAVENVVAVHNTSKAHVVDISVQLPNKILSLLKMYPTKQEFVDNANKVIELYLNQSKIGFKANDDVSKELANLHSQYTAKPSGISEHISRFFTKVLEACKILSKDSREKEKIDTILKSARTLQERENKREVADLATQVDLGDVRKHVVDSRQHATHHGKPSKTENKREVTDLAVLAAQVDSGDVRKHVVASGKHATHHGKPSVSGGKRGDIGVTKSS